MTGTGAAPQLNQADVVAILSQLRDEVRARRSAMGEGEASPLERDLQRSLDEIELHRVVSAHWPLIGNTIPQRAVALLNKLVRRYLRWYINPIVEQQNAYNDAVARTLRLLADAYVELGEQIAENREPRTENRKPDTKSDSPPRATEVIGDGLIGNAQSQLVALVRERAIHEPPARFPDLELRATEPQLRLREQVLAHWPLTGSTIAQRAVALLNKLVRRYLRWYINPIVEQQNSANAAIRVGLVALIRLDAERRGQAATLRAGEKMKG